MAQSSNPVRVVTLPVVHSESLARVFPAGVVQTPTSVTQGRYLPLAAAHPCAVHRVRRRARTLARQVITAVHQERRPLLTTKRALWTSNQSIVVLRGLSLRRMGGSQGLLSKVLR